MSECRLKTFDEEGFVQFLINTFQKIIIFINQLFEI